VGKGDQGKKGGDVVAACKKGKGGKVLNSLGKQRHEERRLLPGEKKKGGVEVRGGGGGFSIQQWPRKLRCLNMETPFVGFLKTSREKSRTRREKKKKRVEVNKQEDFQP